MEKVYDLVAIGRAALDLNAVEYNRPMEETETFKKYVGGSPANIAIGSAKLGQKVAFIGKFSDDQHGRFIRSYMDSMGIDMSYTVTDEEGHKTGLTFTEIKSPTESSILMYREEVADLYLKPEEVDPEVIKKSKILLISGTALAQSPSREAVLKSLSIAQKNDTKIIFEVDYRPYNWKSPEEISVYYSLVAEQADIVIGTREEFDMVENDGISNNDVTVKRFFDYRPELIVIKHGVQGSYAYTRSGEVFEGRIYETKVLKSFGAGDSYAAAFIYALNQGKDVPTALKYGAASASIVISQHSSSEAMPTVEEIEQLIADNK